MELDPLSEAGVVGHLRDAWSTGRGGFVATANVDFLRLASQDPILADIISRASLVVADGMPLVWAARLAGHPVPERVAGSSLIEVLSAAAAEEGRTVFFLGGEGGIPETAGQALLGKFPGLTLAGAYSPPFGFDQTEDGMRDVVRRVTEAAPDLVFVGLGFPKQEMTILRIQEALPQAWFVGCGAGIPMAAGIFRRAPVWMQQAGLEWLFRLALEPRRLAGRYLKHDLIFALGLLASAVLHRVGSTLLGVLTGKGQDGAGPGYICFSGQDWWYHNQSHSDFQLMRSLSRNRRVLVVNSIGLRAPSPRRGGQFMRRILRKLRSILMLVRRPIPELPNFHVMSPVPFPFYSGERTRRFGALLVRAQVGIVAKVLRIPDPVIITTLPTAWEVVRSMSRSSLVYNRSDRHSEFPDTDKTALRAMESALFTCADHVLYVSRALLEEEESSTGGKAYFLDHGVDLEHFRRHDDGELPADVRCIPGPRLGFFGSLDDYLVDFDLLEQLAREIPHASLVLIGDATCSMERFTSLPNVYVLGSRPYAEIPAYGSAFDVGLMPWVRSPWIWSSNPIKLKEYLALGLPVVSTGFAEVEHYRDLVRVANEPDVFVELVSKTLADRGLSTPDERRRRVLEFSWNSRAERIAGLVERSGSR